MKWEKIRIDEIGIITSGGTPSTGNPAYWNGEIGWITPKDLSKYEFRFIKNGERNISEEGLKNSSVRIVKDGSVLLSSRAPIGYLAIAENELTTNQGFKNITPNEKCDSVFLFYCLKNNVEYLKSLGIGATYPELSASRLKEVKLSIPPLPTQQRIASILSAYDDLIENNLKRIKLLEEKAFASYKLIVKSEKLIEGKVGDLADVKSGYAFKSRDWSDEGFPVIKIKNIGNNDIDLTDCSFIPESIAEAASKFKLNAGDLLIAMTGATVGKIGMMPKTETSFYLNQRVGIFKPKVKNAELFLFCFFNEPTAKNAVESLASGAAQPNISGGQLESIKMYYPKLEIVTEFGDSIKSHFELIWNLKEQNTKLREARDILLPKLMNGQIEV
ncbi:MAG TPA: restriction endonuclease subunit S [Saprospiraceae bacterium]|nr:restriction endonuclease subunit S [Saprospiraceae bacterium]HRP42927.1 restriction endonuclease subunit S [Saprospiraceae bacterium]